MRNKTLKNVAIMLPLLLIGLTVLFVFPAEADKSQVEFEASLTVPPNDYQYKTTLINVPAEPESVDYMASFNVPNGEIVKFYPLDPALFELWQEGKYQPSWVEGSRGDFGMGISSEWSQSYDLYLVVLNDASSSVDVNVQLSKVWHESNKLGWLSGSAMVSLGIGVIPLLMFGKSRRQVAYSATIFAMACILVLTMAWAPYSIYPPYPSFILWALIETVPGLLYLEAFPLAVLLYMLHRNKAFTYFRNWNVKKQLQISGVFLMAGFIIPLVFMVLRIFSLLLRLPLDPDAITLFSVISGGLLMVIGTMIFIKLWATHHQTRSSSTIPKITK